MNSIKVIRHLAFEDLGSFSEVIEGRQLQPHYYEAASDSLEGLADSPEPLIILGGPISANDSADFAFLADEIELLQRRIAADLPTLGICLGAQLIARAAGARVYPGAAREIGWGAIELTAAGADSVLAELAPNGCMVLHWHGETFDLPAGAEWLASSEITRHQAFSLGKRVLALQFHVEATASGLEHWFIGHIGEIEATPGLSVAGLRQQTQRHAADALPCGQAMLAAWLDSVTVRRAMRL